MCDETDRAKVEAHHEQEVLEVLGERDRMTELADRMAHAIAVHLGVDIGEHSSANDPWANALDALEDAPTLAQARADERNRTAEQAATLCDEYAAKGPNGYGFDWAGGMVSGYLGAAQLARRCAVNDPTTVADESPLNYAYLRGTKFAAGRIAYQIEAMLPDHILTRVAVEIARNEGHLNERLREFAETARAAHPDEPERSPYVRAGDVERIVQRWVAERGGEPGDYDRDLAHSAVAALRDDLRLCRTQVPEPAHPYLAEIRRLIGETVGELVPKKVSTIDGVRIMASYVQQLHAVHARRHAKEEATVGG